MDYFDHDNTNGQYSDDQINDLNDRLEELMDGMDADDPRYENHIKNMADKTVGELDSDWASGS